MDLTQLLKLVGIGAGGTGVGLAVIITIGYYKLKDHSKRVCQLENKNISQDKILNEHGTMLAKIDTQVDTLVKGQTRVLDKLDKMASILFILLSVGSLIGGMS